MRSKTIEYAIDLGTDQVVSRVGDEFLWPVLDFEKIGQDGNFNKPFTYTLTKMSGRDCLYSWSRNCIHTKQIPLTTKNEHRALWGFPLLKERVYHLFVDSCKLSSLEAFNPVYRPEDHTTHVDITAESMKEAKNRLRAVLGSRTKIYGW